MKDNVVLIHCHDLGRHLGAYGAGVTTPNLDRLAASSVLFERAYCASPLCSPARAALMTGRYPHSNGMNGLVHLGWQYGPRETTIAHHLGRAGYHTALVGLQHEALDPSTLGYSEVVDIGIPPPAYCGPVAHAATTWLAAWSPSPAPFFLTIGFFEAHRPYPVDRYRPDDPSQIDVPDFLPDNEWTRDDLACFQGSIRAADEAVGRVLDRLDRLGHGADTWVVFTTDHGMAFPRAKSTLYEPGVGVALMIRPPTRLAAAAIGRTQRLFSHVDFIPTVLRALGVDLPAGLQGVDQSEFLLTGRGKPARAAVFCEKTYHDVYDPMRAIRTAELSYIRNFEPRPRLTLPLDIAGSATAHGYGSDYLVNRPEEELYDLRADPGERINVARDPDYTRVRDALAAELAEWQRQTSDPLLEGPVSPARVPRLARLGALPDSKGLHT